ncbi:hypothetical protein OUZ56_019449 [Daphnia magna]|uniref:Peptidase S1 domain-containing protein n=1 Tax=Daphnia magna TaxID=35525 RepID=A0ABQ9ZBM2_9CRUS|nr:hypothetical protein OUZ56_019449 [Daphnia magna]
MTLAIWALGLLCLAGFVHPRTLRRGNGTSIPSISIVGGTPVSAGELSHLASLALETFSCGGTLIGPFHVLTAAHCLNSFTSSDRRLSDFTVYLNTLSINGGEADSVTRKVSTFVLHENFDDKTNNNDIALLVLDEAVTTIDYVTLPKDDAPVEPTAEPTEEPTAEPTEEPTAEPTEEPTAEPTEEPTAEPTEEPTAEPTEEPTAEPTED